PVLNRAQADAGPRREVTLDQAGSTSIAEQQAAKRLRPSRRFHARPRHRNLSQGLVWAVFMVDTEDGDGGSSCPGARFDCGASSGYASSAAGAALSFRASMALMVLRNALCRTPFPTLPSTIPSGRPTRLSPMANVLPGDGARLVQGVGEAVKRVTRYAIHASHTGALESFDDQVRYGV